MRSEMWEVDEDIQILFDQVTYIIPAFFYILLKERIYVLERKSIEIIKHLP